jgi:hypothetical protein
MKIDYTVTDEQLRAYGIEQRIIDLSRQPYLRVEGKTGAAAWQVQDIDLAYVNRINEAKDRVALAALAINNPDEKHVWYPPHFPMGEALMGIVRHDR